MSLKYYAAALLIVSLPVCAQAQQKAQPAQPAPPPAAPKPTKAAAQKVIQIISADKAKTKLYCDIAALSQQIEAASQKKDEKQVDELAQQAEDMGGKIGPEFVALMDGLQDMNPESKEAEEIGNMLEALDKLCAKK
jgi:mevalonate kinase